MDSTFIIISWLVIISILIPVQFVDLCDTTNSTEIMNFEMIGYSYCVLINNKVKFFFI